MQPYQHFSADPTVSRTDRSVRVGDVLVLTGGLFIFLFSFAPFMTYSDSVVDDIVSSGNVTFDGWFMAWSVQMFMAPLTWWVILAGPVLVALATVRLLTARDPEFLRFRASQLQVGLALCAFLAMLGYALSHKQISFGLDKFARVGSSNYELYRPSFGWGGYLMVLGALVATCGAVLNLFDTGPSFAISFGQRGGRHGTPAVYPYVPPLRQPAPSSPTSRVYGQGAGESPTQPFPSPPPPGYQQPPPR